LSTGAPTLEGRERQSGHRGSKILALAELRAAVDVLERVLAATASRVHAVALVGDLTEAWSKPDTYRSIFKTLGATKIPTFWVPGRYDAPLREYLSESYNMEITYPSLHDVHGTVAHGEGAVLFAGMGGEILDRPEAIRAEEFLVRYPGWEVEYRLKVLRELKPRERVFLFATAPAHKGLGLAGSEVLAELVKTYDPTAVIVGGETPRQGVLGKSLLVAPGRLDQGHYAVVDLRARSVEHGRLTEALDPR
jgi:Icc-related predicted phosphoesterase